MPSDNHPNPGQPIPQTVHVALYEHRYGTDVRAFLDSEEAMHWRTEIAKEWWTDAFDDDLPPDDHELAKLVEAWTDARAVRADLGV